MSDRRLVPANARVAAEELRGRVQAPRYVTGEWRRVCGPLADLLAAPGGARDRQLARGERFEVFEHHAGHAFGRAARDGYVGYIAEAELGADTAVTHRVAAAATHVYPAPDIRARELCTLSIGALVRVTATADRFAQTDDGFLPAAHLRPLAEPERDPVAVAERLIGSPYLWGGNGFGGLDCSALIQIGCLACAIPCPGDSDLQEAGLGAALPRAAALQRGDVVFWRGHVGWIPAAGELLHANAHHMAVVREPLAEATARIAAQGGGAITARRRPAPG